jgi:hypothetical protein
MTDTSYPSVEDADWIEKLCKATEARLQREWNPPKYVLGCSTPIQEIDPEKERYLDRRRTGVR